MKKTIKGYNANGAYHGYQEWYRDSRETRIWHRSVFIDNQIFGYAEYHRSLPGYSRCMYHIR